MLSADIAMQKLKGGGAHSDHCNVFLPPGLSCTPFCSSLCVMNQVLLMISFGSCFQLSFVLDLLKTQLSATDVSARTLMKGTAKCDKHCELQNSVNQQGFERILRFRDIPESMPASASLTFSYLVSSEVSLRIRYVMEKHSCFFDSSDAFSGYPTCCCDNTVKCAFCILSSVSVAMVGCLV